MGGTASIRRGAARLLVAVALLMRVLLPSGVMLSATPGGAVAIAICSGTGPMTLHLPGKPAPRDDHAAEHPCAFASAAAIADAPSPAPALATPIAAAPVAAPLPMPAPGRGLAAPPPPKTGPPSLR